MGLTAAPGPGHNGGPTMEPGASWRRHCWGAAREALLPTLPIEVLRGRIRRAAELGIDYRSYASIRATSGHDVVAFLFSSNALRVLPQSPVLPADRAERLSALVRCARLALAVAPLTPVQVAAAAAGHVDAAHPAPRAFAGWSETRVALRTALGALPGDGVVLVGDTAIEREWLAPAKLAGWLPAERFFAR